MDLVLDGNPVSLGSTTADPTGAISTSVAIPADTTPGTYNIVATGASSGVTDSVSITVEASSSTTTTSPGSSTPTTVGPTTSPGGNSTVPANSSQLPLTGVGAGLLAMGVIGLALVLIGTLARRRMLGITWRVLLGR